MKLEDIVIREMITVPEIMTIYDTVQIMAEKNIGAVLVTKSKRVAGVFTERDLIKKVIPQNKSIKMTTLAEVMTKDLVTVPLTAKPTVAMDLMLKNNIRHLPATDEMKQIVGILGIRDVMRLVVKSLVQLNRKMAEELDQLRFLNL